VQRVHRPLAELGQPPGMPHRGALGAQSLILSRLRVGLAQLFELPAEVLLLAPPPRAQLFEITQDVRRRDGCGVSRRHARPQLESATVRVEQRGLGVGVEQRVMFVLAVQRHEPVAQLAQLSRRGGSRVDACRASLADLAPQDDRIECGLHRGSISAVANLFGRRSRAEDETERVDDQRLAAAGLAGEQVEARPKTNRRLRDQGKVAHLELLEHYFLGTSGLPQPSLSARR